MGIAILEETQKAELEDFRRMLLSCAAVHRRKDGDGFGRREDAAVAVGDGDATDRMVCVTNGVSYLGIAIVNQLLVKGYSVRIIVDNEEDVERLREMEISGEMRLNNSIVEVVMAKLSEVETLIDAFDACHGVFHTAAFVDPAGLSGYTKVMADVEVNATKNVMKACQISPSVRNCVLSSSLLTCIWREHNALDQPSPVIDHKCWSDESVCISKKLWCALGKLRAEKSAWEIAKEGGFKLTTICPGLITGPDSYHKSPTSTRAYLKGIQEMYTHGLLATVDVSQLAIAHVRVFEEMKKVASGRYICFDRVLKREDEVEILTRETGINVGSITGGASSSTGFQYQLSNAKLARVMLRTPRCYHE